MGGTLAAHVAAINEFREFLGEESISKLSIDDSTVEFSVQKTNKLHFLYQSISSAKTYPRTPALVVCKTNQDNLNLEILNAKLSEGQYSIAKALSLLGRQLNVDLEWTLEALNEADGDDVDGGDVEGAVDEDDDAKMSEDEDMSDQDIDILREWSRKLRQLELIEQGKTLATEEKNKNSNTNFESEHSEKQIFDTKAAFRRLLNELEEIFKAQDMNLMVDVSGSEGLFHWEVFLAGFDSKKSNLAADLHQTGRRFGLSSVHLQIEFKRGLHPFYPPSVRILSPRFIGPVLGAVACFPLLHPKSWDPVMSGKDLIMKIKEFLEEHARVNLEASTPTYHQTEILVTRLSALTGIQPVDPAMSPEIVYAFDPQHIENNCGGYSFKLLSGEEQQQQEKVPGNSELDSTAYEDLPGGSGISPASKKLRTVIYKDPQQQQSQQQQQPTVMKVTSPALAAGNPKQEPTKPEPKAELQTETEKAIAWNKGVGYGIGRNSKIKAEVWDARRAEALQDARDAELYHVLTALSTAAEKTLKDKSLEELELQENAMQSEGGEGDGRDGGETGKQLVLGVLKSGCLVPFLIKELSSAGFQGMASRSAYYRALLGCVDVLCLQPETACMLWWHAENDLKSLVTAVSSLKAQASTFLKVLGDQATGSELEEDYELATLLIDVAEKVALTTAATSIDGGQPINVINVAPAPASAAVTTHTDGAGTSASVHDIVMKPAHSEKELQELHYVATMSPFKVALVPGIAANHSFLTNASKEPTAASRQRARRVASELASLESDLPVNASSSVFVCADEQQTVLWKALITGPTGTPYESGCFLFDLYFPPEYPNRAPHVKLRTTGGGTVRFNPNLYNCGKVCLSLLGTWQGDKGETWSAEYSSILQVLISIQSLIFVDHPFYNEPGYESRPDDTMSNAYSADIMAHTVQWAMLDQLKSPPQYFAEAIKSHFRERGDAVLATVRRWEQWCLEIKAEKAASAIERMLPELENEIMKLKNVDV